MRKFHILFSLFVFALIVSACTASKDDVLIVRERHDNWANDPAFISKLSQDANPKYAANKRMVLEFEAALIRAQSIGDKEPGNIDEIAEKYMAADYVQNDPSFPQGLQGFVNFFRFIKKSGERVSHPPSAIMAEGDLVTLLMFRPPLPDPDDKTKTKTYTGYRIAIWRIKDGKLLEHWGPGTKGNP